MNGQIARLLVLAVCGLACAPDPVTQLLRSAPSLNREFAIHLIRDDDSTLVAYCRNVGWSRVYFAQATLSARDVSSKEAFLRSEAGVLRSHMKLTRAMGVAFDLTGYSQFVQQWAETTLDVRYRMRRSVAQILEIAPDTALAPAERSERIEELQEGCPPCRVHALSMQQRLALESGDREAYLRDVRAGIGAAQAIDHQSMVCWFLGSLGEAMRTRGDLDSTALAWQAGLDLATRHGFQDQIARFHVFLGNLYANEGRWALAEDHLREARDAVRRPEGAGDDARYFIESLEFPARIGCWDLVGRDLRAAGAGMRRARQVGSPWADANETLLLEMQARVAGHTGDVNLADRLFRQLDAKYSATGARVPRHARLLARWARTLTDAGRLRQAEAIARRGIRYCETKKIPEYLPSNAIVLARTQLMTGHLDECGKALDTFRHTAPGLPDRRVLEWVEHDAIRARWCLARGDRAGALAALREGLERLETNVVRMDATPESYSFLSGRNELRDLTHELVSDSPEAGYEIEHQWRRATSLVRADTTTGVLTRCADLVAAHERSALRPAAAAPSNGPTGDVQLIYYVGDRVLRWTRDQAGLRRDVLDVPPRELEMRIQRVTELMARDPGDLEAPVDPPLLAELTRLATQLLPREVIEAPAATRPRWLRIFAHGALVKLPFETLSLSSSSFRPLQSQWDIAYVRGVRAVATESTRGGMIVADPELSPRMRQTHGNLQRLPFGRGEAERLAQADRSALTLFGASATKRAVTATWESSRYLFFASHVAEDPDMPYGAFIPLAPDTAAPVWDREYLETADVLAARLERCDLVVLSGCASGVGSRWVGSSTPSLAAAFLDAGVAAAVRTAWPVRDDHAAGIMGPFVDLWVSEKRAPEVALNQVRRSLMVGAHGFRHPYAWAAYGVELADLPD